MITKLSIDLSDDERGSIAHSLGQSKPLSRKDVSYLVDSFVLGLKDAGEATAQPLPKPKTRTKPVKKVFDKNMNKLLTKNLKKHSIDPTFSRESYIRGWNQVS